MAQDRKKEEASLRRIYWGLKRPSTKSIISYSENNTGMPYHYSNDRLKQFQNNIIIHQWPQNLTFWAFSWNSQDDTPVTNGYTFYNSSKVVDSFIL